VGCAADLSFDQATRPPYAFTQGRESIVPAVLVASVGTGMKRSIYLVSLNNSFLVGSTSRHHVGGKAAVKQCSENEDAKSPQLPQDHPKVVAGNAQHRVHRIAERAFEPVAIELSVGLHMADGWLDCTSPSDHRA
jgi:hypothetical protein